METPAYQFLSELLATASVTGFEQKAAAVVRRYLEPHAESIRTDVHGNVFFSLNPGGGPRVMIASHMDQIGFLVNHIDDKGYLYLVPVGGVDITVVPGSRLSIHGANGPVLGVIGRKAIHMMKPEERENPKKLEFADLHVDIGVKSRDQALKQVQIGDPVTFQLGLAKLGDDLITAHALDDRVGVFVMAEALRLIASDPARRGRLKAAVFGVATVQEEIGLRGALTAANQLEPHVGIAVDVCHATDCPGVEEKAHGSIKMGGGPSISIGANINSAVNTLLANAAKSLNINLQREAAPRATGTDANTMQISKSGIATAILGLPCRYMHTPVEVVSLSDLTQASQVLAETLLAITPETDLIPR